MQWKDVSPSKAPVPSAAPLPAEVDADMNEEYEDNEGEEEPFDSSTEAYKEAFSDLPDISSLSKDDLFQKAVEASYWAGYWAAAYHVRWLY